MDHETTARLNALTQRIATLHRACAKEMATGPFAKGVKAVFMGSSLGQLETHVIECSENLQTLAELHAERQTILNDYISRRRQTA